MVARRLIPGQTHFVTRRTRGRSAFLQPTQAVNEIVLYALGVAQLRAPGVQLHAFTTEVTHHHDGITDSKGLSQLSVFYREFHSLTARALNAHYGRGENLWSQPGSYDNVEVHDCDSLEEQLLYVWTQPLKDGLSPIEDWPGILFRPEDFGRSFVVRKPSSAFFGGRRPKGHEPTHPPVRRAHRKRLANRLRHDRARQRARDRSRGRGKRRRRYLEGVRSRRESRPVRAPRNRDTLPDEVTITISRPPGYAHLSLAEVRAHFRRRLDARVAEILAERASVGLTHFMGAAAVLAQDPLDSVGDTFPTFATNPRIAGRGAHRIALLTELQAWRLTYRESLGRWRSGDRQVLFPHGSYHLPEFHGAETASPTRAPPFA